jgi:hypothetical protein
MTALTATKGCLQGLTGLRELWLHKTCVTDAGLANLTSLGVETLGLGDTGVTDGAVVHLVKLQNLQTLNICGTSITSKGVARLRESLPKLKNVYWDGEAANPD